MMPVNRRILIVDDNADIHNDFKKILGTGGNAKRQQVNAIEMELFDDEPELVVEEPAPINEEARVSYELDFAYQGEEAVRKVNRAFAENRPYALVFMDVRMPPGIDGIETIARIWENHRNVEMVICTAYSDYSFDGVLEKLGSTDRLLFLTKPFDSIAVKQMALSLSRKWTLHEQERHHVELLESEAQQRRESESRLHEMIHQDPLTRMGNRRKLTLSLSDAIEKARRTSTRFALFYIELNRFNEVIDTLGYQVGDKMILLIADRLRQELGERCELFRHGNHEFALLLPDMHSLKEASQIAERIHKLFEHSIDLDDLNIDIHTSVSIVVFPDHGANADLLMRHGDMSLLYARRSERGYCYYDESMNKYSPQRLMLLSDLKKAINNDELLLYFQPRLGMKSRTIVGVEALTRWSHMQLGFVPPASFIPIAEQCGLIKPLTNWVLNKVCEQWMQWKAMDMNLQVSINITAHDLQDTELAKKIKEALDSVNMEPHMLSLEISEKGIMVDRELAVHTLSRVHALGVRVVIDNFGTGYSSLAYLKNLPVNEIKIDNSFIEDLKDNPNEIAIVRSMIELGHNLGLEVGAEGVSSEVSMKLMEEFRCDYVQGLHINAPVPSGELALWLEDTRSGRSL